MKLSDKPTSHILIKAYTNTPCAVIPLGYFDDDTIHAIVEIVSL